MLTLSPFVPQSRHDDEAVPIRWQCPQAVTTRVYTAKSDVYSFGVLLYEIYSGGATPYGRLAGSEVLQMVKAGERLARPSATMAEDVFALMRACTALSVSQRPSMTTVHSRLAKAWTLEPSEDQRGAAARLPDAMAVNPLAAAARDIGCRATPLAVDNSTETSL